MTLLAGVLSRLQRISDLLGGSVPTTGTFKHRIFALLDDIETRLTSAEVQWVDEVLTLDGDGVTCTLTHTPQDEILMLFDGNALANNYSRSAGSKTIVFETPPLGVVRAVYPNGD
jgi:hypothetical protein